MSRQADEHRSGSGPCNKVGSAQYEKKHRFTTMRYSPKVRSSYVDRSEHPTKGNIGLQIRRYSPDHYGPDDRPAASSIHVTCWVQRLLFRRTWTVRVGHRGLQPSSRVHANLA